MHTYTYCNSYNNKMINFKKCHLGEGCQHLANTMLCCRWRNSHPCTPDEPCLLFYVSFCCQKCPLCLKPKEMVDSEVDPTRKAKYVGIQLGAYMGGLGHQRQQLCPVWSNTELRATQPRRQLFLGGILESRKHQILTFIRYHDVSCPCCWYYGCTDSVHVCELKHVWDGGMWVIWGKFNGRLLTGSLGWNNGRWWKMYARQEAKNCKIEKAWKAWVSTSPRKLCSCLKSASSFQVTENTTETICTCLQFFERREALTKRDSKARYCRMGVGYAWQLVDFHISPWTLGHRNAVKGMMPWNGLALQVP